MVFKAYIPVKKFSVVLMVVALLIASAPTSAQTVITKLGKSPVTAPLHSTAELVAHRRQILAAAKTLKLSQGETETLTDALDNMPSLFQYVVLPRHLDAITGMGPNGYEALFNVTIPPTHTVGCWLIPTAANERYFTSPQHAET